MIQALLLAALTDAPGPEPSATPPKTITTVKSIPFCTTLTKSVLPTIQGLQFNDNIIASSKPLMIDMGKLYVPASLAGEKFDQYAAQWGSSTAGGTHTADNPGMQLAAQRLEMIASGIVHNLDLIEKILNDPTRFPNPPKTDQDRQAILLKQELQQVADQQKKALNVLYGLADTLNMQTLIAHGDGTQGAINGGGASGSVAHNDQDVSFQDPISGPERGRNGHAQDPTVDTDPAISQKALGTFANNPLMRFYAGVVANQQSTAQAENQLTATVLQNVGQCK